MKLFLFLLLVGVHFIQASEHENNKKRKRQESDKKEICLTLVDKQTINYIGTLRTDLLQICEKYLIPTESSHLKQTSKKIYHDLKITGYHNIFENNGSIQVFRNMEIGKQNEIKWDDPQNLIPIVPMQHDKKFSFANCLRLPEHQMPECIYDEVSKWNVSNMDIYQFLMKVMFKILEKIEGAKKKRCQQKIFNKASEFAKRGENQALEDVRKIIEILKRENSLDKIFVGWEEERFFGLPNTKGFTALTWAAYKGYTDTVKILLEAKVGINIPDKFEFMNRTALMHAAFDGNFETMKLLLKEKAEVNTQCSRGGTALILAAYKGHLKKVKALLKVKAKINVQCNRGKTALIWAVQHPKIVNVLLEENAEINVKDNEGETALIWAVQQGNLETVKTLLKENAEINVQDNEGKTALIWAVQQGNLETVKTLLEKKAKLNVKDNEGKTALMYALLRHREEIAKVIKEKYIQSNSNDQN